ncbi:MAG: glycoside hydrolase family 3 N-terminal domain-containing protein [Candidatus Dormibacteria bacterium]
MTIRRRSQSAAGILITALILVLAGCGPQGAPSKAATAAPFGAGSATVGVHRYRPPACSNQTRLASWSVARLATQLVIVPVEEEHIVDAAPAVAQGAGGVLLFGSQAPPGMAASIRSLVRIALGGIGPLVMTDEEGGGVQRMANLVGQMPWARQMAQTMSPGQVEALAKSVGARMLEAGVTMDLAPVADVDGGAGPNASNPDGMRSFSANPQIAATYALAFAHGLVAAGVIPVFKHFPGLGGAKGNPDSGPAATQSYSSLVAGGLVPFRAAVAAGVPVVMVSDASVPGLTSSPASLSAAVINGLLVQRMGFSGLVITDSLNAGAILALHLSIPQAAVRAIAAGADMVMFNTSAPATTLQTIAAAVETAVAQGEISRASLVVAAGKVLATKGVDLCLSPEVVPAPRTS